MCRWLKRHIRIQPHTISCCIICWISSSNLKMYVLSLIIHQLDPSKVIMGASSFCYFIFSCCFVMFYSTFISTQNKLFTLHPRWVQWLVLTNGWPSGRFHHYGPPVNLISNTIHTICSKKAFWNSLAYSGLQGCIISSHGNTVKITAFFFFRIEILRKNGVLDKLRQLGWSASLI